jgi:hypothetical protein
MKYPIFQIIFNKLFAITFFALVVFPNSSLAQEDAKLDMILGQVGYIVYTMLLDPLERNKMGKEIYKLFTEGGIEPLRNIIIISDEEPIFEAFLIFVALIIPFPFNVKMDHKYKIILGLSKVGLYHLVAAFIKHH